MTRDIDMLVREAAPVTDDDVRALALGDDLVDAIVDERRAARAHRPRPRRRLWPALGLGTLAAGAAAAVLIVAIGGGASPERTWAAGAVRVANTLPRFLVGLDGWTVRRADQFSGDDAEMTVSDGRSSVDLHWRPDSLDGRIKDRDHSAQLVATPDVLGQPAKVFLYENTADDHTALWRQGRFTMELRGNLDREAFLRVLGSLKLVDVDTWLSAMPPSSVLPVDQEQVVREMLADVPKPKGFDLEGLASDDAVRDRYQLGARVTGAVACAWIEQWAAAKKAGDKAAEREAVQAMQTSRRWKILHEMQRRGAWSEVLWDHADGMAGSGRTYGGKGLPVEESVVSALGCG